MNNNKEQVVVSIQCLAYNHAAYIRQCLDGFIMQQTDFKFEAIVHDDASTDGTTDIIREYANKYPHIIKPIYEKENQYSKGIPGLITKKVAMQCKGKYIAICEGDDYWIDPFKLQKQVVYLESHPDCYLCGTNGLVLYEGATRNPQYFKNDFRSHDLGIGDVIWIWPFPKASLLVRANIYRDFPEWTKQINTGDLLLILLCLEKGNSVFYFGDITCVYRKDEISASSASMRTTNSSFVHNHIILYEEYNKYSNYKYDSEIQLLVSKLKKYNRFVLLRRQNPLLPCIMMPKYCLNKGIKRLVRIVRDRIIKKYSKDLLFYSVQKL